MEMKPTQPSTPTQTPIVVPQEHGIFDRSICFTFFQPWLEAIRSTAETDMQKALDALFVLGDYCLYAKEPDPNKNPWGMAWPVISAEARRSISNRRRGFGTEDVVLTEAIRNYYTKHPGITQQAVADALHCSIGKVNKVVRSIHSDDGTHRDSDSDIHIHSDSGRENNRVIQGMYQKLCFLSPDNGSFGPAVPVQKERAAK